MELVLFFPFFLILLILSKVVFIPESLEEKVELAPILRGTPTLVVLWDFC